MKNNIMIYFRFCFLFLILGSLQSQDLYWANANAKPKADEYINSIMLDNSTAFYWCTDRVVITLDHGVNWLVHRSINSDEFSDALWSTGLSSTTFSVPLSKQMDHTAHYTY